LENVSSARGAWNGAYLDELCVFPNGRYDDQVDASSGAFARLARVARGYTPPTFLHVEPRSRLLFGTPFSRAASRAMRFRHRQTAATRS
jgi:hypothetical protein